MNDYIAYISEFASAFVIVLSPLVYKLYKELLNLRKSDVEQREKLAYLKGKYRDKVVLKSHGKKPKDELDE